MLFLQLIKENDIIRRYIVMNSFDGVLTILGIVIAMLVAGAMDANIVIISSIGVIIATGVSGIWGGYSIEKAERKRNLKTLEKHLMRKLKKTQVAEEYKKMSLMMGLANGLSSSIVSFILIIPFFLAQFNLIGKMEAYFASIILIIVFLFGLGFSVGTIAKEKQLQHGLEMIGAGILVGIIIYFFELIKVI
ncbi:VIT1/CCC1 transporter family protein [Candidatus Micrarchaeota archaeon]|nr:VIT1/CCC1 transporter family protein [Candidatus Micrarchaeota archaeon]MBU2476193.1 VIT1/CCC1 transporter family protein [Candidatus Micrarchaeota archaeon]